MSQVDLQHEIHTGYTSGRNHIRSSKPRVSQEEEGVGGDAGGKGDPSLSLSDSLGISNSLCCMHDVQPELCGLHYCSFDYRKSKSMQCTILHFVCGTQV